jgi:hypothetical protein
VRVERTGLALLFQMTVACGEQTFSAPLAEQQQTIVYGMDDRREPYEVDDPRLRELARSSLVALVAKSRFVVEKDGQSVLLANDLRSDQALCADQRFAEQPALADCSGVLIDDDLVLTAGHCFVEGDDCARYVYAFDFAYEAHRAPLTPLLVRCRALVLRAVTTQLDYAIVQLERPVADRAPVALRSNPLELGEGLVTMGFPSALPAKIDQGARVRAIDPRLGTFTLDSDTFQGSSGSPIVDAQGALVGVLGRGGVDYVSVADQGCRIPNVVGAAADGGYFEQATPLAPVRDALCASGWPSARLCQTGPDCSDTRCSTAESAATCATDCEPDDRPPLGRVSVVNAAAQPNDEGAAAAGSDQNTATPARNEAVGCSTSTTCAAHAGAHATSALFVLMLVRRRRARAR